MSAKTKFNEDFNALMEMPETKPIEFGTKMQKIAIYEVPFALGWTITWLIFLFLPGVIVSALINFNNQRTRQLKVRNYLDQVKKNYDEFLKENK